ncbi:hypothetical protein BDB00DRAFT_246147 [Zychaea mexicana]|uniref:uncharacterized protein n=1 Tax=Zychaea mexicana TaxID=64656 RepID=UPI0022FF444D|nr:uncharacterized protein BDB00DRAFT_246147 [Zychaea mexicana]KAI9495383.1 hypothetical protein BDB00DRAFT_246147 [Zychaea mexicana]
MSSGEYRSRRPKKQQGNQKKGVKPVTRTIALTDSDAKWKIEGVNWSEQLLKVRVESEKKAKKGLNLPDFRELSLNYVFLFSKIMNQSVTRRFGSESHESVWGSLPLINKLTLSAKAASWTKKMLNMATTATPKPNLRDFKKATSKWMVEACDDDDDELLVFGDLLHRSVPRLLSATISETVEDTFVYNTVSDMLNVVFGEDQKLLHEWVNKKLPDTEANITMKPDFVAATKPAKRTVYLFSVEIKPSRRTSDDDICEDRVKLGNQMKTMMQTLESFHIENAQTIGLLIQGYDCTLYLMDNVYKPIYRMIEMYSFSLPKTIEEISVLEHAVECLLSCKAVVERNANEVEKHFTFE